jgi:hypothetical protein
MDCDAAQPDKNLLAHQANTLLKQANSNFEPL